MNRSQPESRSTDNQYPCPENAPGHGEGQTRINTAENAVACKSGRPKRQLSQELKEVPGHCEDVPASDDSGRAKRDERAE